MQRIQLIAVLLLTCSSFTCARGSSDAAVSCRTAAEDRAAFLPDAGGAATADEAAEDFARLEWASETDDPHVARVWKRADHEQFAVSLPGDPTVLGYVTATEAGGRWVVSDVERCGDTVP